MDVKTLRRFEARLGTRSFLWDGEQVVVGDVCTPEVAALLLEAAAALPVAAEVPALMAPAPVLSPAREPGEDTDLVFPLPDALLPTNPILAETGASTLRAEDVFHLPGSTTVVGGVAALAAAKKAGFSLPEDRAVFRLAKRLSEVLELLRDRGCSTAEEYVRACRALLGDSPVLARVPDLVERVVGACIRLGYVAFTSDQAAEDELVRLREMFK